VIQLGPFGSDAMFEIVEISDACFVHVLLQYAPHAVANRIKSGEFGGHTGDEMNSGVFLSRNSTVAPDFDDVKLTSSLRSVVQVVTVLFKIILVTLNVEIKFARNYENRLNFVKVMPKILVIPFFLYTVYT